MSSRKGTKTRKRKVCDNQSDNSEDITDKYINDILKSKHMLEDICAFSGSSDVSSRCNQYEKLTKQIEEYTWVQCDNADCQKWRKIQKNVADQLSDDSQWFCQMNEDKLYNNCSKAEEDYTAYDKLAKKMGYKYVMSQLTEGTLVWAKMHGYCRWPGIVTKDPITEFYMDIDGDENPTHYHVEYLGKTHSHAWITANNITLYGHREDPPKSPQEVKKKKGRGRKKLMTIQNKIAGRKKYKQTLVDDAVAEAEEMINLTVDRRLQMIKFIVKPKHESGIPQIKTEPADEFTASMSEKNKTKEASKLSLAKTPRKTKQVNGKIQKSKMEGDNYLQQSMMNAKFNGIQGKQLSQMLPPYKQKGGHSRLNSSTVKIEIQGILSEGTLVLAKQDGYNKWPAVITRDPHNGLQYEINPDGQLSSYHVEFLGPSHSHAWLKTEKVSLYDKELVRDVLSQSSNKSNKHRKSLSSPKTAPSKAICLKLDKAMEEAENLISLSEQERLSQCKFRFVLEDDFQCRDSGFESWNYPASSANSAASSAEQFECSKLDYNSSLVDKSKEERFKIDVEMYKKNEKAFIHDLSRFMRRNNLSVRLTANWHHVPVGAFQLFLAVHERGGFNEVCKKKQWTSVFRELTETQFNAGPGPKKFYQRNIYPYELYITGENYESEIKTLQSKSRGGSKGDVMIEDDTGSFTNVDDASEESDDLTAILEDLEEYSSLCQLEEDIEAEKKRMGINISYHDESPYAKVSPGVKVFNTPSEFNSPKGKSKKHQHVPGSMFSVSSGDTQNDLVFHQMQRIVESHLL